MSEFYKIKIEDLQTQIKAQQKQSNRFSRLRLSIFLTGCILSYFAFTIFTIAGYTAILLFLSGLISATIFHRRIDAKINYLENLVAIYANELNIAQHNLFGAGKQYIDNMHNYTSDLDIFGDASLFAYINRTVTKEGSDCLADFLRQKANAAEIIERQKAFAELAEKQTFKEQFLEASFLSKFSADKQSEKIHEFITHFKPYFLRKKAVKYLINICPAVIIISFALGYIWAPAWIVGMLGVLTIVFISLRNFNKVSEIDEYVGKYAGAFNKYAALMNAVKDESFVHPLLQNIQTAIIERHRFNKELQRLSKLSQQLDYRRNMLAATIFFTLFPWDIHIAYAIEKWFERNRHIFAVCLSEIGRMDAYLSMAISYFNHPEWNLPAITEDYFVMKGKTLGHPLIPESKRVCNDFQLDGTGKTVIITGSNMAGKSTFLRTLGVNMVLAFAGGKICGKSLTLSLADVHTYMRIRDSLNENTSTFYAELLRIKHILAEVAQNKRCFLLLDELLRGTNSKDKYIGSAAIIRQLVKNDTIALLATHDLELTGLQNDLPTHIINYHFDISVHGEEFYFDYKLREGICRNFNACLLMKKIGIEVGTTASLTN